jgi:hypothetical protein
VPLVTGESHEQIATNYLGLQLDELGGQQALSTSVSGRLALACAEAKSSR